MNLRKDHSHVSTTNSLWTYLYVSLYEGWELLSRSPVLWHAGGGSALDLLPLSWSYRWYWTASVFAYRFGWLSTSCIKYNFQRRMSRLEQRWRAQRSVISIVNCRIPWTNRDLNVYCAFGISLKACLLQCLLIFMPHAISKAIWFCLCAYLCVKALSVLDTFSAQVLSSTSNLNNTSVSCVALLLVACLPQFKTVWSHSWHEVRLANPLNLSI